MGRQNNKWQLKEKTKGFLESVFLPVICHNSGDF